MRKNRVLVACERSQKVTKELRREGIEAYSCDLRQCTGGKVEWHIKGDVLELLQERWSLIIAFPPCTHIANSGAQHFPQKRVDGTQERAIEFFLKMMEGNSDHIAVENPVGIMSNIYRKPDQMVQPWMFGDEATKTTCLWLKNLPLLTPTNIVGKGKIQTIKNGSNKRLPEWYSNASKKNRAEVRSTIFDGLARAMALQWGVKVVKEGGLTQKEMFR